MIKRVKKPTLKHAPFSEEFLDVVPAKLSIPKWYTETKPPERKLSRIKTAPNQPNFRLCYPFLDTLTTGYVSLLPVDIAFEKTDTFPNITWPKESEFYPVNLRKGDADKTIPVPEGHNPQHFAWTSPNAIKLPEGYSALITHPLNRYDLPFTTLSGIIDGNYAMHQGSIPVFFKENFEGVIPRGTPIFQIIPFKSENWTSTLDPNLVKEANINKKVSESTIIGWYKNNHWKRKLYE